MTNNNLNGTWILEAIGGQEILPNVKIFANFDTERDTLQGNGGCNFYFGNSLERAFDENSGQIRIGPIASTRMSCGPEINEQERRYIEALEQSDEYQIVDGGKTLWVFSRYSWVELRFTRE